MVAFGPCHLSHVPFIWFIELRRDKHQQCIPRYFIFCGVLGNLRAWWFFCRHFITVMILLDPSSEEEEVLELGASKGNGTAPLECPENPGPRDIAVPGQSDIGKVVNWVKSCLLEWISCRGPVEWQAADHLWWRTASSPTWSMGVKSRVEGGKDEVSDIAPEKAAPAPSHKKYLGWGDLAGCWRKVCLLGTSVCFHTYIPRFRKYCLMNLRLCFLALNFRPFVDFRLGSLTLDSWTMLWFLEPWCCRFGTCGYCDFPLCLMARN